MKIALLGYGRMGKAIEKIALERGHSIQLRVDQPQVKLDLSEVDVAIDFSLPESAYDNIHECIDQGVPVVSGTTGWLDRYDEIVTYCEEKGGAFLYGSNFSIGVNLFFNLNEYLAGLMKRVDSYNVSMEEIHHVHKLDAPSGTAISLAEGIINEGIKSNWTLDEPNSNELGIRVKRQGEVPGTHSIRFESSVDQIEIKHEAFNRGGFALGAVVAAEWVKDRTGVFGMKDVLSL